MNNIRKIHEFALEWLEKFKNPNVVYTKIIDCSFKENCEKLGFESEKYKVLAKKYGKDLKKYGLENFENEIEYIDLLGCAILSNWKDLRIEVLETKGDRREVIIKNRDWFISSFELLKEITEKILLELEDKDEDQDISKKKNKIKKISISSQLTDFCPVCPVNSEDLQKVVIKSDGKVKISGYTYENEKEISERTRKDKFKIGEATVNLIFEAFEDYFENEFDDVHTTGTGYWEVKITRENGKVEFYECSFLKNARKLSEFVRCMLEENNLMLLDGNFYMDRIEEITLSYSRMAEVPFFDATEHIERKYSEYLTINGKTKTIEFSREFENGNKVYHKYEVGECIDILLSYFENNRVFERMELEEADLCSSISMEEEIDAGLPVSEESYYSLTIYYENDKEKELGGIFDFIGLPDNYDEFINAVSDFLKIYNEGDIFDKKFYYKGKGCKGKYMFASVVFPGTVKSYYYLTEDESIEVGDYVIVPVGPENERKIVQVVNIEYFEKYNAPYPVDKIKRIIKKCYV